MDNLAILWQYSPMYSDSFNKIAARPPHEGANRLIDRIIAARPDLRDATFVVPRSGNTSITVITMHEVFKAHVYASEARAFSREIAVLEHLQQNMPAGVELPRLTCVAPDRSFYGMTRLHGLPLTRDNLRALPDAERRRLGGLVGAFNAQLGGAFGGDSRRQLGLQPKYEAALILPHHLDEALEDSRVRLALGTQLLQAQQLCRYVAERHDDAVQETRLRFLHADMHEQNFLYDPATKKLGVIDLGPGDHVQAEYAFSVLHHYYGDEYTQHSLDGFAAVAGLQLSLKDLTIYQAARALRYAAQDPEGAMKLFRKLEKPLMLAMNGAAATGPSSPPAGGPKR